MIYRQHDPPITIDDVTVQHRDVGDDSLKVWQACRKALPFPSISTTRYVGDLTLTLIAPDGTRVTLASQRGGDGDGFSGDHLQR